MAEKSFSMKKRTPQRSPKKKNDIYINRKTDFKAQLERCQKLLDSSHQEVWIHGLGAAINRAINLALQLKHRGMGTIETSALTSSVELIDDFEPLDDEHESHSKVRTNSAIHIRVYRIPVQQGSETASKP
ncbi:ribonuclease P protein subunit p20-like [Exaiptasia diaphana]|uniref:Ribonuclease P protein subunit p20 n=1 Tax=Exaiptasia diaphana TaxID=2652724 RepID=A0A913X7F3_EXADI|nr:ribonuclease P protein subunit p20-like [Exaiptasia diaphana]